MSLVNTGIGPAIIKKFEYLVDSKVVSSDHYQTIHEALKRLNLDGEDYRHYTPYPNEAMSPGERKTLFKFPQITRASSEAKRLKSILPRLRVRIGYASIYKEEFTLEQDWC